MKRVEKLAIAAGVLLIANAMIFVNAWSLPQERVTDCVTVRGVKVCH